MTSTHTRFTTLYYTLYGKFQVKCNLHTAISSCVQIAEFKLRLGRAKRQILTLRRQLEEAQRERDEALERNQHQQLAGQVPPASLDAASAPGAAEAAPSAEGAAAQHPEGNAAAAAGRASGVGVDGAAAAGEPSRQTPAADHAEADQLRRQLADSTAQVEAAQQQAAQAAAAAAASAADVEAGAAARAELADAQQQLAQLQQAAAAQQDQHRMAQQQLTVSSQVLWLTCCLQRLPSQEVTYRKVIISEVCSFRSRGAGRPTESCPCRLPYQAQEEAERQLVAVQQQLGEALAEAADAQVGVIWRVEPPE